MSKDSPRLSRLGVLAPAALSACMDASVLAVPAAGAIVSTVLKELSKAFMLKKWYHGIMSAKEAENLMMEKGRNGSFLVRESQAHPGEYVLSVRVRGRVSHVMIRKQDNKYDVGSGEKFDDLVGLIEHFRSYPMIETSGDVLRLLQPVSGTRLRAHDIGQKVKEMNDLYNSAFDMEFHALKMVDDLHVFTLDEGVKEENIEKNRYRNVIPYDQTRVVLRVEDEKKHSDYINANYIRSNRLGDSNISLRSSNESLNSFNSFIQKCANKKAAAAVAKLLSEEASGDMNRTIKLDKMNCNLSRNIMKDKMYIATQGCLTNTIDDFWRMLWQEDVRVVVMITNEEEKGKQKCDRYWPSYGQEEFYDELLVRSISETAYEDYFVREFDVSDKNVCKTIYQYQFTSWPDHGTPVDPDVVLMFVEDINRRMYRISREKDGPDNNILCVHCSAGVGRTGTFIVIDMIVDKIKQAGFNCEIDVHNTVKLVRAQRIGMVQNKAQYRFIYLALQCYIDKNNIKLQKKMNTCDASAETTREPKYIIKEISVQRVM